MPSTTGKSPPKWLIDTDGMRAALTSTKNSVRVAIISAIENGDMHILKRVSGELRDLYPDVYKDFQSIKKKKYVSVSVQASAAAAIMMENSGTSLIGSVPPPDRFEAVAASRKLGCTLVSAGKAHSDCCKVALKNGIPKTAIIPVTSFG